MEHQLEEVLEAVWVADEDNKSKVSDIQKYCSKVELTETRIKPLENEGLIRLENNRMYLTPRGKDIAGKLTRRHRLSECLMGYVLNLPPETMERVACETEHSLLPEVEESICTLLGHPETAPDGRPVPPGGCCTKGLCNIEKTITSLHAAQPGDCLKIAYIKSKSHTRLKQLSSFGIVPGLRIKLLQKSPAFCMEFENTEIAIDQEIANDIFVWKCDSP